MKTTRYSEPQILSILRQAEGGVPVCRCRSCAGVGVVPRAWHEQCFVLQVASKVWWDYHRSLYTPAAHTLTYFRLQTVDSVSGNICKLTGSGWQLVLNTCINLIVDTQDHFFAVSTSTVLVVLTNLLPLGSVRRAYQLSLPAHLSSLSFLSFVWNPPHSSAVKSPTNNTKMLALESPKFHRHFVYELCTEILKQHIVLEGEFKFILQHIVEAGTGIEPVYTDLQSAA